MEQAIFCSLNSRILGDMIGQIEDFLTHLKVVKNLSDNTISAYKNDLMGFVNCPKSKHDPHKYIASIQELSPVSVNRKISALKGFYSYRVQMGIATENPLENIEQKTIHRKVPNFLTDRDVAEILNAAYLDTSPQGIRTYTILLFLHTTGMRISECISLPLKDFHNFAKRDTIIINGKGDKERIIILNPDMKDQIRRYLKIRDVFAMKASKSVQSGNFLFCAKTAKGYVNREAVFVAIKTLAKTAGVDESKVSPHSLRHSFATKLYSNGINLRILQEMLGHSSISTTEIYTHTDVSRKLKSVEKYHPLSRSSKK